MMASTICPRSRIDYFQWNPRPNLVYTFVTADSFFSMFLLLYQAQLSPNLARAVFKDYFRCFRGLEKPGFSQKKSCGSKCLFVDLEQAEPAEFTIQVNAASISFLYLWLLISESSMRFIFQDNSGISFKQEKSEILVNIMNVGCGIELLCDVYYISQSLALRAVFRISFFKNINKSPRLTEAENQWILLSVWLF